MWAYGKEVVGKIKPFKKSRWNWKKQKERLDVVGNTVEKEMRNSNRMENKHFKRLQENDRDRR